MIVILYIIGEFCGGCDTMEVWLKKLYVWLGCNDDIQ